MKMVHNDKIGRTTLYTFGHLKIYILKKFWINVVAFILTNIVAAQQYNFKRYEVGDGLAHNTVQCAVQDGIGFMWFGTKNGLVRFDGHAFKTYFNTIPNNDKFIINNILSVEYSNSNLWIGTYGGLFRFDLKTEKFHFLKFTSHKMVTKISVDPDGNIWYTLEQKIYKYDTRKNVQQEFALDNGAYDTKFAISEKGSVWFYSRNNLYRLNLKNSSFHKHNKNPLFEKQGFIGVTKIEDIGDGQLLLGTNGAGVYIYSISQKSIKKLDLGDVEDLYVRSIWANESMVWIGTESGVFIYNRLDGSSTHLEKEYGNPFTISDNAIYDIVEDRNGGKWVCTFFGGINYITKQITPFKRYYPIPGKNTISGNAVREIEKDSHGNLWIGTEDGGLNKLDHFTGVFTHYPLKKKSNRSSLQHDNIHGLLAVDDEIWVGTFEDGLYRLKSINGKIIKHYQRGELSGFRSNFIHGFFKARDSVIYVNTDSGIYKYNRKKDLFFSLANFPENLGYTSILEDRSGGIWAGTYWDGLYYHNPITQENKHFALNNTDPISSDAINGIFQDSKNNIWVTTENGLNLMEYGDSEFKVYDENNGFPSNIFYTLLEDRRDSYWITTANGLVHYQKKTGQIRSFFEENGILSNQFNYKSGFHDSNGILYFGSGKGLISFNPKTFTNVEHDTKIALTSLKFNNHEASILDEDSPLTHSITYSQAITLNASQSSFTLEFSSMAFNSHKSVTYSYKLKGLKNQWVDLGANNIISFTHLPSGSYNLFLRVKKGNGKWQEGKNKLAITVLPSIWASNPAIIFYIFLVVLIILLFFRFYNANIHAKNNLRIKQLNTLKEREIYEAKIKFFTNISHEIRTPLSLIKSPLEKLLKIPHKNPDLEENLDVMRRNTSRLLDLTNQILDFRNTEMERMNLGFTQTNINDLIKNTYLRFKPLYTDDNKIDFQLSLPGTDIYASVDAEALNKILSNLFSNAIKYAQKHIFLELKVEEDFFLLRIGNDGELVPAYYRDRIFEPFFRIPNDKNIPGSGLGLSLSLSLAELHHGSLTLDTSNSSMNIFKLKIPLHQENNSNTYPTSKWVIKNGKSKFSDSKVTEGHTPAILLVEDNEDLLDFVAKDLNDDYLVIKAVDAQNALSIIETESIQLIISDVMMPGEMDGFDLCEKIKTNIEWSHIPIILLTAKSTLEAKSQGLESGADAYIEKPFSMDHLKLQMSNLLKNRLHIIEHYSSTPLAHIRSIAHTKTDENFIKKLDDTIYKNISDQNLNVDTLADIMNMSRSTLYRKIKSLSNLTPNELINITRLKRAAELLSTGNYRIYEISQMVGYNSTNSFGRNFQKQFKMSPTEYMTSKET